MKFFELNLGTTLSSLLLLIFVSVVSLDARSAWAQAALDRELDALADATAKKLVGQTYRGDFGSPLVYVKDPVYRLTELPCQPVTNRVREDFIDRLDRKLREFSIYDVRIVDHPQEADWQWTAALEWEVRQPDELTLHLRLVDSSELPKGPIGLLTERVILADFRNTASWGQSDCLFALDPIQQRVIADQPIDIFHSRSIYSDPIHVIEENQAYTIVGHVADDADGWAIVRVNAGNAQGAAVKGFVKLQIDDETVPAFIRKQIEELANERLELTAENRSQSDELRDLRNSLNARDSAYDELQSQFDELSKTYEESQSRLSQLDASKQAAENRVEQARGAAFKWESEYNAALRDMREKDKKIDELELALKEANRSMIIELDRLERKHETVISGMKSSEEVKATLSALRQELNSKSDQLRQIEQEKRDVENSLRQVKDNMASMMSPAEFEDKTRALRDERDALAQEMEGFRLIAEQAANRASSCENESAEQAKLCQTREVLLDDVFWSLRNVANLPGEAKEFAESYLNTFPNGKYRQAALETASLERGLVANIGTRDADSAWLNACGANKPETYSDFATSYPNNPKIDQAIAALEELRSVTCQSDFAPSGLGDNEKPNSNSPGLVPPLAEAAFETLKPVQKALILRELRKGRPVDDVLSLRRLGIRDESLRAAVKVDLCRQNSDYC